MPAIQTAYTTTMRPALAGMHADMMPERIATGIAETTLGFGVACFQGTGDTQVRAANGTAPLVGVTFIDQSVKHLSPTATVDQFTAGDTVPVMKSGRVWVLASVAVVAGTAAYVVPATGVFTNVATANTPVGVFVTSAAGGALTKLSVHIA